MEYTNLEEFFTRKGAIDLILSIDKEDGNIQTEVADKMDISKPIASNRLEEAEKIGLLDLTVSHEDHGNANRYQFTSQGRKLRNEFETRDLDSKHQQYKKLQSEINEGVEDILQNFSEIFGIDPEEIHTDVIDDETITKEDVPEDVDSSDISTDYDFTDPPE